MPQVATKIKLLLEWSPVLSYATRISDAKDDQEFVLAVTDLLAFLSAKSSVQFDDELVRHVGAIVRSEEGKALIEWGGKLLDGIVAMEMPPND